MSFIKDFLQRNKSCFALSVIIWSVALIFGIYSAAMADGESFSQIDYCTKAALSGNTEFRKLLTDTLGANLRFTLLLCLCFSFIITSPAGLALIGFKGFASGFAASALINAYSFRGTLISLVTIVLPHSLSLPVVFAMFTASLRYINTKLKNHSSLTKEQKKKEWLSYAASMLVLYFILCILSAAEAFLVPKLMKLIN